MTTGTEAMTAFLREILTAPVSPAPVVRNGLQKPDGYLTARLRVLAQGTDQS